VYVVLSFEIVHRTTIALFGAVVVIAVAITLGNFQPSDGLEQILGYIDLILLDFCWG
jgi:hypothetical protein